MRFLLAMATLSLIMALPLILFIGILIAIVKSYEKKHGRVEPTPEQRKAWELDQIRQNLEEMNARQEWERWHKR